MAKRKRVGIDVDGVLADFTEAFKRKCEKVFPGKVDKDWIPSQWQWGDCGLTKHEVGMVWKEIVEDKHFWEDVKPLVGAAQLNELIPTIVAKGAAPYFVSSRAGTNVREQTANWINTFIPNAKTDQHLIIVDNSYHKIEMMHAMRIEAMLDDYAPLITMGKDLPTTRVYLMRARWNEWEREAYNLPSVGSVTEYLEKEKLV